MTQIRLTAFGDPRLEYEGKSLELETRKALALFIYLAVSGQSHSRDALATLLWPETDQTQGRTYLRRALWLLRRALGENALAADRQSVQISPAINLWIDVAEFHRLLTAGKEHAHDANVVCATCADALSQAVDLYQGDFLAGFSLPDAPEFDDWQYFQSESLRSDMAAALEWLTAQTTHVEDFETALGYARRRVQLDPLHEPAQRALMHLYTQAGQHSAALRQYEICTRLLDEEFGLPPEPKTTDLYEAIKAGRAVPGRAGDTTPSLAESQPALPPPNSIAHGFLKEEEDEAPPATVFVARERELAELAAALESARQGQGQILLLIGGAGRGKTQLTQEFARRMQTEDPDLVVISGNCDAMTGIGDPYLPFRGALAMLSGDVADKWAGGLMRATEARRLWNLMPVSLPALVEHAPDLIGDFVAGPGLHARAATFAPPDAPWFATLATLARSARASGLEQQRIFSQYTAFLKAIAARQPILFIIEDLHWIDTASSGLLFHLSREIGDSPILIIGTYRPEEVAAGRDDNRHPLTDLVGELKRRHGDIWLDLDDMVTRDGRHFVDAFVATLPNKLNDDFREALFNHTGGYALFTVELLRAMQDRGDLMQDEDGDWVVAERIDWTTLPAKVEGVIETRIRRLDDELRAVLMVAAVEGESFTAEVVAEVQELNERRLVQQLSRDLDKQHRLVTAQTLERAGAQRLSRYRFRHQLFQHYLYHSLDDMERGYLHEAVGNALERLHAGRTDDIAVQLAWHFQEAGLVAKAVGYLRAAGDGAARVYAHNEAIAAYRQALALIDEYGVEGQHQSHIYRALGRCLELNSQWKEALILYEAMMDTAQRQGDRPMRLTALMAQVTLYATPTPLHNPVKGPALGEETLALAREVGDQAAEARTLWNLALCGMWSGRTGEGIAYAEQAVALARRLELTELQAYALNDLGMLYAAVLDVGRAETTLMEAGELWRDLENLPMLADNISMRAMAHVAAGNFRQAIAFSDESYALSEAHANLWGKSYSRMMIGLAYWELGDPDRALAVAEESVSLGQAAGFVASQVLAGGFLAAILGKLGAVEQGLDAAGRAVAVAQEQFPHFRCHPLGIMAQLCMQSGDMERATELVESGRQDRYRAAHPTWNMMMCLADAELSLRTGAYTAAIATADCWLPKMREHQLWAYAPAMLQIRGEAQLASGSTEAGRVSLREASAIVEQTGAVATLWPILNLLAKTEVDAIEENRLKNQAHEIVNAVSRHINDPALKESFLHSPQVQQILADSL